MSPFSWVRFKQSCLSINQSGLETQLSCGREVARQAPNKVIGRFALSPRGIAFLARMFRELLHEFIQKLDFVV